MRVQWRNNRACKACSARGPSAVGGPKFARRCFSKVFFGKRGPFWNTCTRAHCNLVTPLCEFPQPWGGSQTAIVYSIWSFTLQHMSVWVWPYLVSACPSAGPRTFHGSATAGSIDVRPSRTRQRRRAAERGCWHTESDWTWTHRCPTEPRRPGTAPTPA